MLCVTSRAPGRDRTGPADPARQPLLYQGRCCPLRICGRKILLCVVAGGGLVTCWRRERPGDGHGNGQDRPGEGASSCHARGPCTSSAPSRRQPAAGPGGRPGVPLPTGPPLRAVPAAACSRACGGCWPRCPAARAALTAQLAGTAPGSARRRSRTEHPLAGHATYRCQSTADGRPPGAGHIESATPLAATANGLRDRPTPEATHSRSPI
jgi:hypothetical protein